MVVVCCLQGVIWRGLGGGVPGGGVEFVGGGGGRDCMEFVQSV